MMPGNPGEKDYDDPIYDPFWEAAVALELPLSWHILTTSGDNSLSKPRGPKINGFLSIIRGCQDIMGMLVFSGVFERHPRLRVVCVEADAGWAPHFMYRMDHAYKRHRYWMKGKELARLPSEYFRDHIALTFQDDWTAFQFADRLGRTSSCGPTTSRTAIPPGRGARTSSPSRRPTSRPNCGSASCATTWPNSTIWPRSRASTAVYRV